MLVVPNVHFSKPGGRPSTEYNVYHSLGKRQLMVFMSVTDRYVQADHFCIVVALSVAEPHHCRLGSFLLLLPANSIQHMSHIYKRTSIPATLRQTVGYIHENSGQYSVSPAIYLSVSRLS